MSHTFTIESATHIQRGTGIENEILAMVKFKELSKPVAFFAFRVAEEPQRRELWERFNSGEFGEVTWPPSYYTTLPKTQLELEVIERQNRDDLLLRSDWSQTNDSTLDAAKKAAWAEYRQKLRDVPTQQGFPYEINWPVKPS
jgi:hypothetical protein